MASFTEFKNGLTGGEEFPVYLFEGEDAYFRERGLTLLVKELVSEPSLNLTNLESDCEIGELIMSLNGYPFMSRKRLTVIREFYPKAEQLKKGLKDYLENPSNDCVLALLNEKPCEALKKFSSVCVVDCKKAELSLLVKWVKAECLKSNVEIDGETASKLVNFCLLDMTRIETETNKLISYAGDGGKLTQQDVDEMVARDTDYKVYEMTDYIAKKKFDLAIDVIKDMSSKGETGQRILSSVYNYFRKLLHAGISGKNSTELALALGIKEYPAKKLIEQSKLFKKKSLKNAVDRLIEADYMVKSGNIGVDEQMWIAVFAIMPDAT